MRGELHHRPSPPTTDGKIAADMLCGTMSTSCVFCEIIAGTATAARLHEDAATVAVLDLRQSNPGHVLVLPRTHVVSLDQLPDALCAPVMKTVVAMTRAVQACFRPDGISVWQSNGEGANQEVPHVHFHVFPRWKDDEHVRIYPGTVADARPAELEQLAQRLRAFIPAIT